MCPDPVFAIWSHRFPGASGPGRPRDRHTRAYGSEWSISKPARALRTLRRPPAPSTPVGSRRPPIGRYLVCSADVPGASGPGRPRDRHTRAYGSEWSISKPARALRTLRRPPAPSTPVGSRRPPIGRYLVCMYLARPCRRPQAPRPGLLTTLSQQTVRNTQTPPCRVRPGYLPRRGRPCLSPGARRAPGAWRAPRRAASRRSGTPTPPTRRPSRSSGTSARPRGR